MKLRLIFFIVLLLSLLLSSCGGWKEFRISEGKHDFRPIDGLSFRTYKSFENKALVVGVYFRESMLYEHGGDPDLEHDWAIKLPGVSLNSPFTKKNKDAVLVAARVRGNKFQVTSYKNEDFSHIVGYEPFPGDKDEDEIFLEMEPDQEFWYVIYPIEPTLWEVRIYMGRGAPEFDHRTHYRFQAPPGKIITRTGLWFGGTKPSPVDGRVKVGTWIMKQSALKSKGFLQ